MTDLSANPMPARRDARRPRSRIASAIAAYATRLAEAGEFSGAIALSRRGRTVLSRQWRVRAPDGTRTRFDLGSLNKMFTAVAICQ